MEYQNDPGQPVFPNGEDRVSTPTPPVPPTFDVPPLKPNNWLWLAIVVTILCCLPFGIVSIIYAAKVDSLYFNGRYEESKQMSQRAKMWIFISMGAALLYYILCITLFVTGNLPEYMQDLIENSASGYNF
jgi:hypothetical protein